MVCRATGAIENLDYWPLRNVSDEGSCYAKANSTISFHSGSDPLGQAGPTSVPLEKKLVFSIIGFKQCCGNRLDSQNLVEGQEN